MKLIVVTNWDKGLLEGLDPSVVNWVSGRLPRDEVGGSSITPDNMIHPVTRKKVEKYIKLIHRKKMKFNYLLDGHCTGNKEYSWRGAERIFKTVKWIYNSGADGVTVAIPHLVQLIKEYFPSLKVGYGGTRVIWEMARVKYFDRLGVDWIILNSATNRNFRLLRVIKGSVKCDLWLVANSGCLLFCNFGFDHDNHLAHASNYTAPFSYTDYFHAHCNSIILKKPQELIKCPWIRPEDLSFYEGLGYDNFLIYPNSSKTNDSLGVIDSYVKRSFEGNLTDLLSTMGKRIVQKKSVDAGKGKPVIDNSKLNGFLDFFISRKGDCATMLCSECGYCKGIAEKAIIPPSSREKRSLLSEYLNRIKEIENGK